MGKGGKEARVALLLLLAIVGQYSVQATHKVRHAHVEHAAHALLAASGQFMEFLRSDSFETESHRVAEHVDAMLEHVHALHQHGAVEQHLRAQADALEAEHGSPLHGIVLNLIQESNDVSEDAMREGAQKLSDVGKTVEAHMGEAGDSFLSSAVWVTLVGVLNGITMGGMDMTQQLMEDPNCASQTRGIKRSVKGVLEGLSALLQGDLLDGLTHFVVSFFKLLGSLLKMLTCPTILALLGILLVFVGVSMAASALGFGLALNLVLFVVGLAAGIPFVLQLVEKGTFAFGCTLSDDVECTDKHFLMMWETVAEFCGFLVGLWIASGVKDFLSLRKGEGFLSVAARVKKGESVLDTGKLAATARELRAAPQVFQRTWAMMKRLWGRRTLIASGGSPAASGAQGVTTHVGSVVAMQAAKVDELATSLDEAQAILDDAVAMVSSPSRKAGVPSGRLAEVGDEIASLEKRLDGVERLRAHLDAENAKLVALEKGADSTHAAWKEADELVNAATASAETPLLMIDPRSVMSATNLRAGAKGQLQTMDDRINRVRSFAYENSDYYELLQSARTKHPDLPKLEQLHYERRYFLAAIDDLSRMGTGFAADGEMARLMSYSYDMVDEMRAGLDAAMKKAKELSHADDGGKALGEWLNSGGMFAWMDQADDLLALAKKADPSGKLGDYIEMRTFQEVFDFTTNAHEALMATNAGGVVDMKRIAPRLNEYMPEVAGGVQKISTYNMMGPVYHATYRRSIEAMSRLAAKGRVERVPSLRTLKATRQKAWSKYEAEWTSVLEARNVLDDARAQYEAAEAGVLGLRERLRALTAEADSLRGTVGSVDKIAAEQVVKLQEKNVGVLSRALAKAEAELVKAKAHAAVVRREQGRSILEKMSAAFAKQVTARHLEPESLGSRAWTYLFGSEDDPACWLGATADTSTWEGEMDKWWYHVHVKFTHRAEAALEGRGGEDEHEHEHDSSDSVWALSPYTYLLVRYRDAVAWTPVSSADGKWTNAGVTLLTDSLEDAMHVSVISVTEELNSGMFNMNDASDIDEVRGQVVGETVIHPNILPRGFVAASSDEARKGVASVVTPVPPLRLLDVVNRPEDATDRRVIHLRGGVVQYAKAVSAKGAMPPVSVATSHMTEHKRAEMKRDAALLFRFMNAFQWSGVDRLAFAVLGKWCTSERNTVALVATFDAVLKEKHEPVDTASDETHEQTNLEYWLNGVMVGSEERCQAAAMLYRHAFDLKRATEDC